MPNNDPKITPHLSATFREFILLPRRTEPSHGISETSLQTWVAERFPLAIPFMSAAMESVTGHRLAIALALHGGLGVLPAGRVEVEDQVRQVGLVKSHQDGVTRSFQVVKPEMKLAEVDRLESITGEETFAVVDEGYRLVGAISSRNYDPRTDLDLLIEEKMVPKDKLGVCGYDKDGSKQCTPFLSMGHDTGYLLDEDGVLQALIIRREAKRALGFKEATRDAKGRLRVAAAISTHAEDRLRAKECVAAGADLISVDASDGFSVYMKDTVEFVKELGVPVVAGNVVDRAGFEYLAECGADAVKVGIGSGSICTTRRVKAIGRGQATAVREIAIARDEWAERTGRYIPIISDGGLSGTGDMAVALALGADVLMMGKYFAGFDESPTVAYTKKVQVAPGGGPSQVSVTVKPYWGEASARAKNVRRYQQDDPRTFVIEGEEGFVLMKGSLHAGLPVDLRAIKGTLSSCGCADLMEFRNEVMLERQSLGAELEGGTSVLMG